ncbi:MAG: hypothetical protein JWN98_2490 [Abditibacteriota bacterium]|nr:hypothetical protein [Abditibacteriota bacterium]
MKTIRPFLLAAALLSGTCVDVQAQAKIPAKTTAGKSAASKTAAVKATAARRAAARKAGKGKNRRTKLIAHWEGVMGRKLSEAQKTQLRRAAEERERANRKFRTDVAKLFNTSVVTLATRERAYRKAHPAKP